MENVSETKYDDDDDHGNDDEIPVREMLNVYLV